MSDWIEWEGGECPVSRETPLEVKLDTGAISRSHAGWWSWSRHEGVGNIIAYRLTECAGETPDGALGTQISGNHYLGMKIQPIEFINANNFDFLQGSAIKYLSRHKLKGKKADVEKAIHFCKLILELQYGEGK